MNSGTAGRIFAACIAAIAWAGLAVQYVELYNANSSAVLTLWIMAAYFTITTNLLVAVVFTSIAANRSAFRSSGWIAGTMLFILLVGVVVALLLRGALELSGGSALVDKLLHVATPILAPIYWLLFVRKGELTWRHPLLWAIYPLAYLVYAIGRGMATGKYAYPFLNLLKLGWQRTALNAFLIAVAFMLTGFAIVWLDQRLGSRSANHRSPNA